MSTPDPLPKVAIVTGASVGIGKAVAARFLAEGARVFGISRRPCPVEGVESLRVDLGDPAAVETAIAELDVELETLGDKVELHLIQNAAVMPRDSVADIERESVERALRINLLAPMMLNAGLRPRMGQGSSILYVGSTLSEKAVPGRASYVTTKHGLVGLMRATVQDLFGQAIHTACVCPGFTDTEMLKPVLDADPALREAVLAMVSFGRLLEPEEIADVLVYASKTPALNGALIHANLGQRES